MPTTMLSAGFGRFGYVSDAAGKGGLVSRGRYMVVGCGATHLARVAPYLGNLDLIPWTDPLFAVIVSPILRIVFVLPLSVGIDSIWRTAAAWIGRLRPYEEERVKRGSGRWAACGFLHNTSSPVAATELTWLYRHLQYIRLIHL